MSRFKEWKPPTFNERGMTRWNWMCIHPENLMIGRNVDVGAFTLIQAEYDVVLEDDVQIAGGCKIYSINTIDGTSGKVVIKKGACVGGNSVVLPGVTIGEEAIVGALSLVKTDVPAGEVWGGVPARRIKQIKHKSPLIPLTEIFEIDPEMVKALRDKGIEDVLTLAQQSTSSLSEKLEISLEKAQYLIREARLRMERI